MPIFSRNSTMSWQEGRKERIRIKMVSRSSGVLSSNVLFVADLFFFVFRVVGVFDTVGSVGLPEEVTFFSKKFKQLFGFQDKQLGPHIQHAFHAMALNETRADFVSLTI